MWVHTLVPAPVAAAFLEPWTCRIGVALVDTCSDTGTFSRTKAVFLIGRAIAFGADSITIYTEALVATVREGNPTSIIFTFVNTS